jgi:hypothetical protein
MLGERSKNTVVRRNDKRRIEGGVTLFGSKSDKNCHFCFGDHQGDASQPFDN